MLTYSTPSLVVTKDQQGLLVMDSLGDKGGTVAIELHQVVLRSLNLGYVHETVQVHEIGRRDPLFIPGTPTFEGTLELEICGGQVLKSYDPQSLKLVKDMTITELFNEINYRLLKEKIDGKVRDNGNRWNG